MNKKQLITAVAHQSGVSNADVKKVLESIIYQISESVSQDDEVRLVGFGSFVLKHKKARTGRNPKTGEVVQISAKKGLGFVPSKALNKLIDSL